MQLPHLLTLPAQAGIDTWNDIYDGARVRMDASDYAVGWFTLALINAGIAQGKNRSGLNWFLLSLLFGPIATFLLVAFFEKLSFYEE